MLALLTCLAAPAATFAADEHAPKKGFKIVVDLRDSGRRVEQERVKVERLTAEAWSMEIGEANVLDASDRHVLAGHASGLLVLLDSETGATLWKEPLPQGARLGRALLGGQEVVCTWMSGSAQMRAIGNPPARNHKQHMRAIALHDGKTYWETEIPPMPASCVLGPRSIFLFGRVHQLFGRMHPQVTEVRLRDGAIVRRIPLGDGSTAAAAAVRSDGRIAISSDDTLVVRDASGKALWEGASRHKGMATVQSLAWLGDVLVVAHGDGVAVGRHADTGKILWRVETGASVPQITVDQGRAYISMRDGLTVVRKDGSVAWRFDRERVEQDGQAQEWRRCQVVSSPEGRHALVAGKSRIFDLDADSGELLAVVERRPGSGWAVARGRVFVVREGRLRAHALR